MLMSAATLQQNLRHRDANVCGNVVLFAATVSHLCGERGSTDDAGGGVLKREYWWLVLVECQKESLEGSRQPIIRAASASQIVTNSIPHEKPEERPPCIPQKLRRSNRARDY